jgi:hypothetical protein
VVTLIAMPDKRIFGGAAAGAIAATVWAMQEPLDMKVFGVRYSDAELVGRTLVKHGDNWRSVGTVMHAVNGVVFGAVYSLAAQRLPGPGPLKGAAAGMAEHLATWPLTKYVPRWHPAARKLPQLYGNHAAFAQAVWRHLLFGVLLGALEERFAEGYAEPAPA